MRHTDILSSLSKWKRQKWLFIVDKRYAVCEAKKWRYAVHKAKIGRYAVRKGGGCHPHTFKYWRQTKVFFYLQYNGSVNSPDSGRNFLHFDACLLAPIQKKEICGKRQSCINNWGKLRTGKRLVMIYWYYTLYTLFTIYITTVAYYEYDIRGQQFVLSPGSVTRTCHLVTKRVVLKIN